MTLSLWLVACLIAIALILGVILGLHIADREQVEREQPLPSRLVGPQLATEESEAMTDEQLRKGGWL